MARVDEIRGRNRITITEIPYQVNKAKLILKIAELVKEKRIEGISDIRDDSNRTGLRIVIDLKRDAIPKVVLNNLYKYTQMETTFGIINLALVNGRPKILPMKELIRYYIEHQIDVVTRRTRYDLKKAEARAHIIEGLRIAMDHIDEIIKIIRSSYDDAEIKAIFLKRFGLDDVQSQAILDMRLKRLSGLEREKLDEEYNELLKKIAYFREILNSRKVLLGVIEQELLEIKEKYADARRTKIMPAVDEIDIEDLIEKEAVVISLTKRGYIKRTPADQYKVQQRGGKGIRGMTTKDDDYVSQLYVVSTHDEIFFFTNQGRLYTLNAYNIPEGGRTSRGQAIVNLLQLEPDEIIEAMFPKNNLLSEGKQFVMMTKNGTLKKTETSNFKNVRANGIRAITLADDDELVAVRIAKKDDEILIVTKKGMSVRTSLSEVRSVGRSAMGVKGITLDVDDTVIDMDVVKEHPYMLVISENGFGKKTLIEHYGVQKRGGKGLKTYKVTKKTGNIVAAMLVEKGDEVLLMSQNNDLIRLEVAKISTLGRATQGVKLKDVRSEDERIVAVAKYMEDLDPEEA